MRQVGLVVAGFVLAAASFAGLYLVGLNTAGWLRQDAVYCADERSLTEARAARGDANWLAAIPLCRVTPEPYRVRVLGCGLTICRVRVWDEYGFSGLGVTSARSLTH